jgi:hypothetical protein
MNNKLREIIVEELKNSKTFEKYLWDMQKAYEDMDFYYNAGDDQNELHFWDKWTTDLPNELIEQLANNIISKYGEWEVVAEGRVTREFDSGNYYTFVGSQEPCNEVLDIACKLDEVLKKYANEGKQIEIGIRVID